MFFSTCRHVLYKETFVLYFLCPLLTVTFCHFELIETNTIAVNTSFKSNYSNAQKITVSNRFLHVISLLLLMENVRIVIVMFRNRLSKLS